MKDFKDKVAVVTGAASGIGRALAARCIEEGMKVVLADIERQALYRTADELGASRGHVLSVITDVSDAGQVASLCQNAQAEFGAVHLLFNNAGVSAGFGPIWNATPADWEWVIKVNLLGVVYGVRAFVPVMLQQADECHIVNTASVAGLLSGAFGGVYGMSKHAVVSMSETLHNELKFFTDKIGVSVLCPGFVQTRIMESARNRPAELMDPPSSVALTAEQKAGIARFREKIEHGMPPERLAALTFEAIRENRFYIITHPETRDWVNQRAGDVIAARNPRLYAGWGK
jgi:NAD(P)-dependent dehydrogenase (short-subunit alcohol dehydrogenase family)